MTHNNFLYVDDFIGGETTNIIDKMKYLRIFGQTELENICDVNNLTRAYINLKNLLSTMRTTEFAAYTAQKLV